MQGNEEGSFRKTAEWWEMLLREKSRSAMDPSDWETWVVYKLYSIREGW